MSRTLMTQVTRTILQYAMSKRLLRFVKATQEKELNFSLERL